MWHFEGALYFDLTCKNAADTPDMMTRTIVETKRNILLAPSISTRTPHNTNAVIDTASDLITRLRISHRSWYLHAHAASRVGTIT